MAHSRPPATSAGADVGRLAAARLQDSPYRILRHIVCEWRAGLLILRGRLPSYYLKQLAQATVAGIEGVDRIANEIEIAGPGERRVRTGLSTSSPC